MIRYLASRPSHVPLVAFRAWPRTVSAACFAILAAGCGARIVPMSDDEPTVTETAGMQPSPEADTDPAASAGKEDLIHGSGTPAGKEDRLVSPHSQDTVPMVPDPTTSSAAEAACAQWLNSWIATGGSSHFTKGARIEALLEKPVPKPGAKLPAALGAPGQGDLGILGLEASGDGGPVACRVHAEIVSPCSTCPDAPYRARSFYVRMDLAEKKGQWRATHLSLVLEVSEDDQSGEVFDRMLSNCGVLPGQGAIPHNLCGLLTMDDVPLHPGAPTGEMIYRDIAEVLVFDDTGHLEGYERLGVYEDDGSGDTPLGDYMEVSNVNLGLGQDVMSVFQEKVKPLGGHAKKNDPCAAFMVVATQSYWIWNGEKLVEIFSHEVDVFPDAPCMSDAKLQKYEDLVVDVEPVCSGDGPCDLHLHCDRMTPKDEIWDEVWRFDGKKYVRIEP